MGFVLVIAKGREEGREFSFASGQAEVRIGRTSDNDVVLYDAGVSRTHLRILQRAGECTVEDVGSANGTHVNGQRIDGPRRLSTGDVLTVGTVRFTFAQRADVQMTRTEPQASAMGSAAPKAFVGRDSTAPAEAQAAIEVRATALNAPVVDETSWEDVSRALAEEESSPMSPPAHKAAAFQSHPGSGMRTERGPVGAAVHPTTNGAVVPFHALEPTPSKSDPASTQQADARVLAAALAACAADEVEQVLATTRPSHPAPAYPYPPSPFQVPFGAKAFEPPGAVMAETRPVPPSSPGKTPAPPAVTTERRPAPKSWPGQTPAPLGVTTEPRPAPKSSPGQTRPVAADGGRTPDLSIAPHPLPKSSAVEVDTSTRPVPRSSPGMARPAAKVQRRSSLEPVKTPVVRDASEQATAPYVQQDFGPLGVPDEDTSPFSSAANSSDKAPSETWELEHTSPASPIALLPKGPSGRPVRSVVASQRRRSVSHRSLGTQLRWAWEDLNPRTRQRFGVGVALVVLLVLGGVGGRALWVERAKRQEPDLLSTSFVLGSFGWGEGVTWERPEHKTFHFDLLTPTRAFAVVHARSKDISEGEVVVWLNGIQIGAVPADRKDSVDREWELVLPLKRLRQQQRNEVVFDSTRNPPGEESWRIEDVWLETIPVPELPASELLSSAQSYFRNAQEFERLVDVGPDNLFKAWKNYRYAWVSLEAVEEKPELYGVVTVRMADVQVRLDAQCSKMLLEAERSVRINQRKKARQTLEDVPRYFPTAEHRCHNLARAKLTEYGL